MLLFSLILSSVLLAVVYWEGRKKSEGYVRAFVVGILGGVASLFFCVAPVAALTGLFAAVVFLLGLLGKSSPGRLIVLCFIATIVFHAGLLAINFWEYQDMYRLYPVESLAARLPDEAAAAARLRPVDRVVDEKTFRIQETQSDVFNGHFNFRSALLRRLHESTVLDFVNTPGLGFGRMAFFPSKRLLHLQEGDILPLREPWSFARSESASKRGEANLARPDSKELVTMHLGGIADFVNPRGFGYVLDREHVRGFQTHHFHFYPEIGKTWQVQSVELISLLTHDQPAVYISSNLPRMQDLAGAPTRPLNAFEELALAKIMHGRQVEIESSDSTIRMVGGIYAHNQCLSCHDVERGDLPGAFSYRLEPKER